MRDAVETNGTWFQDSITYSGTAVGDVIDPKGSITGTGGLKVGAVERLRLEVLIASGDFEENVHAVHLASPVRSEDESLAQAMSFIPGSISSRWQEVTLRTPEGILRSEAVYPQAFSFGGKGTKVTLALRNAYFRANSAEQPYYWVLPLTNYVLNCIHRVDSLRELPLRLHRRDSYPDDLTELERNVLVVNAQIADRVTLFRAFDQDAFIELLPDAQERIQRLNEHTSPSEITAVMVGTLPAGYDCASSAMDWFPLEILTALSLANGCEVSSPWLEIRSERGTLLSREHLGVGLPRFFKSHRAVDELFCHKVGDLITSFLACKERKELLGLVRFVSRLGNRDLTTDDRWGFAVRAFELIARKLDVRSTHLERALPSDVAVKVKQVLSDSATQIRDSADQTPMTLTERMAVSRIADRCLAACQLDNDFALTIAKVLDHYQIPDQAIMELEYAGNPRSRNSWVQAISLYRGRVIHHGHADMDDPEVVDDFFEIPDHLHDILLRIVFKMIGYNGPYCSPVARMAGSFPQDWVKPQTTVDRLGYNRIKVFDARSEAREKRDEDESAGS